MLFVMNRTSTRAGSVHALTRNQSFSMYNDSKSLRRTVTEQAQ